MLFSGLPFLVWFLPAVILIHWALPFRAKNAFLLFASLFFYAWGEMRYMPLITASLLINYLLSFFIANPRRWVQKSALAASILVNMGALAYFKYAAFFLTAVGFGASAPDIALPLGISFYTFQTQAYMIDLYRKNAPVEKNFINYATFIMLFPQLIAGPIVLYPTIRDEMHSRRVSAEDLEAGMGTFIMGLSSKVLLANPLGALWAQVQAAVSPSSAALWLGIFAFGLQIYFDFAGYSWMAIGMGKMLGFKFPKNFDNPYASRSIREFWRRWHMTLGAWFREYLYLPLGGNRKGSARTALNLFVVWAVTGLWHGASWNFVAWGVYFFVFIALERFVCGKFLSRHRVLGLCYTLAVVLLGWVLFAHENLPQALDYWVRMFRFLPGLDWRFPLRGNAVLLAVSVCCCVPPLTRWVRERLGKVRALRAAALVGALLLCVASLVNADYNPFLYFRF